MSADEKDKNAISRRQFLKRTAFAGTAAAVGSLISTGPASAARKPSIKWSKEADVVVIGAGATGLPAAIVVREAGASVILFEAEPDIGGHAITSGGNVPLGGGTSAQKKAGINDSPDLLFRDLTDWSIVQPNGFPDYRYNDHEIIRAFADNSAPSFEWLVAHGVIFIDRPTDNFGGTSVGNSVPREMHSAAMDWPMVQTGKPVDPTVRATTSTGNGLMRPLEVAAKRAGVQILLEHRMTAIHREGSKSGRVLGVAAGCEGVGHVGRRDGDLGLRHVGQRAEAVDDAVELGRLLGRDLLGVHGVHGDLGAEPVLAEQEPDPDDQDQDEAVEEGEEDADERGVEHDEEEPRQEHPVGQAPVRLDVA